MLEPKTYKDVLFEKGRRLSRHESNELHGSRVVRAAEIAEAMASFAQRPRFATSPKRIFLSYRWGACEHNRWVRDLVGKLEARGNIVVFDKQNLHATDADIANLVGSMIDCRYFLAIIDPAYTEAVTSGKQLQKQGKARTWAVDDLTGRGTLERGWVYDEYHICLGVEGVARLARVGLLVGGDELPEGMTLFKEGGTGGNVFDVRDQDQLDPILDRFFSNESSAGREAHQEALSAVQNSERAFEARDFPAALAAAHKAIGVAPWLAESHRCETYSHMATCTFREAANSAIRTLEIEPHISENRYMAALAIAEAGRPDLALAQCAMLRRGQMRSWRLSAVMSIAAWCGEQPITAVNHLDYACSQVPGLRGRVRAFQRICVDNGIRRPPTHALIPQLSTKANTGGMAVLQMLDYQLETTFIEFEDAWFPEGRSATARDDIIVSLVGHHLPATDMDELNFMIRGHIVGPVKCSSCVARLPVIQESDLICYDCGLMLNEGTDCCPACKGSELEPLIGAWRGPSARCPFCREGVFVPFRDR